MVGPNSNKIISEHLSKLNDSIDLTSYDTLKTLIKVSTMRRKFFERIVFSSKVFSNNPEKDLKELSSYLYENSSGTTLVLVVKEDQVDLVKKFNKIFKSPLYAIAFIDNPAVKDLMNVVSLTVDEVKERYKNKGTSKQEGVEQPEVQKQQQVNLQHQGTEVVEKPKKQGFFSRLFGKKSKEVTEPEVSEVAPIPVPVISSSIEETPIDINNLSLGAYSMVHADTGYLDDAEFSVNQIPEIQQKTQESDFTPKIESLFNESQMPQQPEIKPQISGVEMVENAPQMRENFVTPKSSEVLVGDVPQRDNLTGKWLLIGIDNALDEFAENFDVVVDLDLVYRPMRKVVELSRFSLSKQGMKSVMIEGHHLYTEGYSAPDSDFRKRDLVQLIKNSNSILVNASIADLDDLKDCFKLFDTIKMVDNRGLDLYLDLDNEDRVLSDTLSYLKRFKIDTSTLNKNYLVSRRVW